MTETHESSAADGGTAPANAGPHRVLVVDDNPAHRRLAATVLTREGLEVAEAADVVEAERALAGRSFDLVVCDLSLPGESGLDLLGKLRATPTGRDLPFIIVSAYDSAESRIQGWEKDVGAVIHKPYERGELAAACRSLLGRRDARRRLAEEEKLRIVRGLAATVAHRINNPLTSICALAQNALRKGPLAEEEQRDLMDRLHRAGRRIEEVVRDLHKIERVVDSTYAGEIDMLDIGPESEPPLSADVSDTADDAGA